MTESIHLLTGAYAVDALDGDERAEFEGHLTGCDDCREELRGLTETAARLAGAEAVVPPAGLKTSVLSQIDSVRQLPPLTPPESAADEAIAPVVELRPRRTSRLLSVAAVVLAVAAVSLSLLLAQARSKNTELSAQAQSVAQVLTAADAHTVTSEFAGGGRGAVTVSATQGSAVLVATALPSPPSGQTYEMWFIDADGKARAAGTFVPGPNGSAALPLTGSPAGSAAVGVTVEPTGGSTQPTTKPILAVQTGP